MKNYFENEGAKRDSKRITTKAGRKAEKQLRQYRKGGKNLLFVEAVENDRRYS